MYIQDRIIAVNKNKRTKPITCIIIHDTGGDTLEGTLQWFLNPKAKVSAHYVIGKDGTIIRCVRDDERAWHAGESELFGQRDVNDFSIGIELVGVGDVYSNVQMASLAELVSVLCKKYSIPLNRIVGHCHIAPGRKVDPSNKFDWNLFLLNVSQNI